MKRNLFTGILLTVAVSLCAQTNVFKFGFEDDDMARDSKLPGWMQFINFSDTIGTYSISDAEYFQGAKSLYVNNTKTVGQWLCATKFRNIPLEDNTSYRVTYYAKATPGANMCSVIMCGVDNSDIPFVGKGNSEYTYTDNSFDLTNWKKVSHVFYFTDRSVEDAYYSTQTKESPALNIDSCFLALNMYSAGEYYVDGVSVDKSTIAGIDYCVDALRVNFGYATDIAAAAKAVAGGVITLDNSLVKVTSDGVEQPIEAVELHSDGRMYIYLDLGGGQIDDNADIRVSFTNPKNIDALKYTASNNQRPGSWDENASLYIKDFSNEQATIDTNPDADYGLAYLYTVPTKISSVPEDNSFDLGVNDNTYTITFNKLANAAEAKAQLLGDGYKEDLQLTTTDKLSNTLTFKRTSKAELPQKEYRVHITNLQGEKYLDGVTEPGTLTLTLNYGHYEVTAADTAVVVWQEPFTEAHTNGNWIPAGWISNCGGVYRVGPWDVGGWTGGSRVFDFSNAPFKRALYYRYGGYLVYGEQLTDTTTLKLAAGRYQLTYLPFMWKGSAQMTTTVEMYGDSINPVASQSLVPTLNVNGSQDLKSFKATDFVTQTIDFKITDTGNYVIRFKDNANNEFMVASMKLIRIPSVPGAYYKNLLTAALANANNVATTGADGKYDGTYKNNLASLIATGTNFAGTSPSSYTDIVGKINAASDSMSLHIQRVDAYPVNVANLAEAITNCDGTKYVNLDEYSKATELWGQYKDQTITRDVELQYANDVMTYATNHLNGAHNVSVKLLTERTDSLASLAVRLGVDPSNELIVKAANSVIDDDDLAASLMALCTTKLYSNLSAGTQSFTDANGEADSLCLNGYIKNPSFYTLTKTLAAVSNPNPKMGTLASFCPGWKDDGTVNGYGEWTLHNKMQVANGGDFISNSYSAVSTTLKFWAAKVYVFQTVASLPVGKYTLNALASNQGTAVSKVSSDLTDEEKAIAAATLLTNRMQYAFAVVNGDTVKNIWDINTGFWPGNESAPHYSTHVQNIMVTSPNDVVTIGLESGNTSGDNTFLNYIGLSYVAPIEGYNYATAIQAATEGLTVKAVKYYGLDGIAYNHARRGVNIMKTFYSNGSVTTNKILVR
jgi:hypothetical protein